MSYAIVFSSKTGNTKLLADTLHTCLPQESCCYFGTPDPAALEADTLYVGFWTDKGKADESSSDFLKQLRGKQVFLFGTAGFGGSEEYFNKILKAVQKDLHSSNTVIGAGSVVTKDIPANVVAVGNPCRVLRPISEHDKEYFYRDRKINWETL